jgi:hypothetical protein
MRVHLLLFVSLIGLACNAGGRDSHAVSGSAGLSAGGGSSTSTALPGTGLDTESTSGGTGGAGTDQPGSTGTTNDNTGGASTGDAPDTTSTASEDETSVGGEESSTGADSDSSGIVDGVLDIGIIAHNDCTFTVTPSSITVPEGTEFTVNWVSSAASEVEFDIAKIDPFNHVPIVIGMEPGSSYHDDIRQWCGVLFTGTFDFRLTSCHDPLYIPVDCGG